MSSALRFPRPIDKGWTQRAEIGMVVVPEFLASSEEARFEEETVERVTVTIRIDRNEVTRTETIIFGLDLVDAEFHDIDLDPDLDKDDNAGDK